MVYTKNKFEWDIKKDHSNYRKHGISFELALTAFDDPSALIKEDPKHSATEIRSILIGASDTAVLFVVFTIRGIDGIYRIISARRANRTERRLYEKNK